MRGLKHPPCRVPRWLSFVIISILMQIHGSLERFISHWVQYGGGRDDGGQLDARLSFNSRCNLIDGSM